MDRNPRLQISTRLFQVQLNECKDAKQKVKWLNEQVDKQHQLQTTKNLGSGCGIVYKSRRFQHQSSAVQIQSRVKFICTTNCIEKTKKEAVNGPFLTI